MRLNRIVLNDFFAYDECDLDLSQWGQVVVVGDVGNGKSSLIDAVTWAIWNETRAEVLDDIIRDGTDACTVRVDMTVDGHEVSITRNKTRDRSSTVSVTVDGKVETKHSVGETSAYIVSLVGMSYEAAMIGPLMLQESIALMRYKASERKDLLLGLYGLERYKAWEKAAKEKRDDAALTVRSHETALVTMADLDVTLTTFEALLAEAKPHSETLAEAVAFGRVRVDELTARTAGLKERASRGLELQRQLDEVRAKYVEESLDLKKAQSAHADATARLNSVEFVELDPDMPAKVTAAEERARGASKAHAEGYGTMASVRAHVEAMESRGEVACPECGWTFRPGIDEATLTAEKNGLRIAEQMVAELAGYKKEAEEEVRHLRAEETRIMALAGARVRAASEVTAADARIEASKKALDELGQRGVALKAEVATVEAAGPELTSALDELASARGALANNEDDLREAEAQIVRYDAEVARLTRDKVRRDQMQVELETARKDAQTYGLLAKAFHPNGIPTLMLESGLPLIEQRTNEVLGRMPGDLSVRLIIAREGGRSPDRVDVVVNVGDRRRPYSQLSGGQKFRVDLALRLGLTKAVAGRSFGSLLIDETLDRFQDAAGREALLESLAVVSEDFGLVLVISHHPEVQERFENRIEVTMEERVSFARAA